MRGRWMVWKSFPRIPSGHFGTYAQQSIYYYRCSIPDYLRLPFTISVKGMHLWKLSQVDEGVCWRSTSHYDKTILIYFLCRLYNSEVQLHINGALELPCTYLFMRDVHAQLPFMELSYHGIPVVRKYLYFPPSLILVLSSPNPSSRDLICSGECSLVLEGSGKYHSTYKPACKCLYFLG